MKKRVSIILVLTFIIIGCLALTGCNENDVKDRLSDLESKITDLEQNKTDLQDKVTALEVRLAKVEKTIAAYEEVSGSGNEYPELLAAIANVKNDLLANTATDAEIKAQVTEMQKKVDQIRFDNDTPVNLTQTQEMLNTLYGQTNPPVHKNGDTFDVGINGVTYYTVTFYGEVHDGIVNASRTELMPDCPYSSGVKILHLCGRISIENKMRRNIIGLDMENLIQIAYSTYSDYISLKLIADGSPLLSIPAGEKVNLHFTYHHLKQKKIDIVFNIATANIGDEIIKIAGAKIPNFWDGVTPPIQGTK